MRLFFFLGLKVFQILTEFCLRNYLEPVSEFDLDVFWMNELNRNSYAGYIIIIIFTLEIFSPRLAHLKSRIEVVPNPQ